jgi:heme A synthase
MFIIPFSRDGWFWSGYGFSVLAMLLTLAVSLQVIVRKKEYRDYSGIKGYWGMPMAWLYLVVQVVLGTLEIVLHFIPYQVGIIINILLFCVCISGLAIAKFLFRD